MQQRLRSHMRRFLTGVLFAIFHCPAWAETAVPSGYSLTPEHVAVVVNTSDPKSVEVGQYYLGARNIPSKNLIRIALPDHPARITPAVFNKLRQQIESQLQPDIEVITLAWTTPYAVDCNSITSAMTLGFDPAQCENTCAAGKASKYFDSPSLRPQKELGMRLTMLLPTENVPQAKALIDRGILSNFRRVPATAYYLITSDANRNSRAQFFPPSGVIPPLQFSVKTMKADSLEDVQDIMVYQTGLVSVPRLETLGFLPGALADHLTSFGGDLLGKSQMSSLRWLEAGATASYGTVSEPCNHWQKFPNPTVLLKHYLSGASAVEAYWKSVAWPAQGLFIGEPLASPYRAP